MYNILLILLYNILKIDAINIKNKYNYLVLVYREQFIAYYS